MEPTLIGLFSFVAILVLIFLGMPVAFVLALIGFIGFWAIGGWQAAVGMTAVIPWDKATAYTLTVVPLFVLMGNLVFHAGFGRDMYRSAAQWVGHFPGGLALATVLGNAVFAAASGSSVSATVTFAKVAVPEMKRYGYDSGLAVGSVAAAGTLAIMIPPSIAIVLYGMVTEQSVGKLLIAGIFPGLLIVVSYLVQITIRTRLNPSLGAGLPKASWKARFLATKGIAAPALLFVLVLGGIYTGVTTPTEAGAFGAVSALLLGLATRRLSLHTLWEALVDSVKIVGMIFALVVGAFIYNALFAISRVPTEGARFISTLGLPPIGILSAIMIFYIILGTFMYGHAILFVTMPTIFPITVALGWNPIWFGILFVLLVEIGMITPPFGLTLFAAKAAVPDVSMGVIIRGAVPFFLADLVVLVVLIAFPQVVLFLPGMMGK